MHDLSFSPVSKINHLTKTIPMSQSAFEIWRKYIYDNCGIYYQDNKKYLLENRLQKRINFLDLNSYEAYLDYIKFNPGGVKEKKYLYEVITINETFFFRNQPQLDALLTVVIPDLIKMKQTTGKNKIRIWSAASSSGEEAYSIAIVIKELFKKNNLNLDFEIIGTDISQAVIDTAEKGLYKEYSIRNLPQYYLKKYFIQRGNEFEIDPEIKKMVSFKLLNLYDDFAMKSMLFYDIIFCANVLIYFDLASKIKVVNHLYNSLNKEGYLFIGYSETLQNLSKAFKLISFPKTIGYKKE